MERDKRNQFLVTMLVALGFYHSKSLATMAVDKMQSEQKDFIYQTYSETTTVSNISPGQQIVVIQQKEQLSQGRTQTQGQMVYGVFHSSSMTTTSVNRSPFFTAPTGVVRKESQNEPFIRR